LSDHDKVVQNFKPKKVIKDLKYFKNFTIFPKKYKWGIHGFTLGNYKHEQGNPHDILV